MFSVPHRHYCFTAAHSSLYFITPNGKIHGSTGIRLPPDMIYFGVDKLGWRCGEVSDYHCTRVSWCLLQNNPEARKRAGQSQTLERGQVPSDVNWELNSQRLPGKSGSYWPWFQTWASDSSEPLPPSPFQLTGRPWSRPSRTWNHKNKCTWEGNQGKGSSVNLNLPTRTLRLHTSAGTTERISQIPHLQRDLDGREHCKLHSSCCCEEQASDPFQQKRTDSLASILCGQQSRSRKNHTEERWWGRQSPFCGQKCWKRILGEWSMTRGSDLRMHMGPEEQSEEQQAFWGGRPLETG